MKHETIRACSIWRALEVVGDVPTLLILEQAFLGRRRFQDFVTETGIARSVINQRLERLVDADVLEKSIERRGGYRLTAKGKGLFPVALMILRWQHIWEADERGFRVRLVHRDCGAEIEPIPACAHCDQPLKCEAQFAGRQIQCPGCQHLIRIPNPPAGMGFTHVAPESGQGAKLFISAFPA